MIKTHTLLGGLTLLMIGCNQTAPFTEEPPLPQATGSAIIDTRVRYQTFQGWGTSLAWWANVVGGWSDTNRNQIMDLLYGPSGLKFNVARYNLGADAPDNVCRSQLRPGGNVQSFATSLGVYDWTRDANQRWVLKAAQARGANLLEAFSNSAPSFMLENHCTAGATPPAYDNLRPDMYTAFADYIATVLQHFKNTEGVTFTTVDPLNEPDSGYWFSGGGQEGMNVSRAEQPKIINEVATAVQQKALPTLISAMDTTNIDLTNTEFNSYPDTVKNQISQINTHAYQGSYRSVLRNTAARYNKTLWMSEYGCCNATNTTANQLSTALDLATTIKKDLNDLQAKAWVYWQAVENNDGTSGTNHTWGLIKANFLSGESYTLTKAYYAMGQFSKFIRPGAQILPISHPNMLAALNSNNQLVVVAINSSSTASGVTLNMNGFTTLGTTAKVYRTSGTENLLALKNQSISNKSLILSLPAQSITTYVVDTAVAAAPTNTVTSGQSYKILNKHSWKALDVLGASTSDSASIGQYDDNEGNNQRWIFTDLGNGYYKITNKNSGKALDVSGASTSNGTNVIQYTYSGDNNQQWQLQSTGNGYFKIINKNSGKLLDVNGQSLDNSATVLQWEDNLGDNQQWMLIRAD